MTEYSEEILNTLTNALRTNSPEMLVPVAAGFIGDIRRIADALERIADAQDRRTPKV